MQLPAGREVHHEVELGVVIGRGGRRRMRAPRGRSAASWLRHAAGRDIAPEQAMSHVAGYTLALDLTARDLQVEAKAKGLPWTAAKGFDTFCPVGYARGTQHRHRPGMAHPMRAGTMPSRFARACLMRIGPRARARPRS